MTECAYAGWARIDNAALAHNARMLRQSAPAQEHMGIVKADAYGHGAVPVSRALIEAGYRMLGIAQIDEALTVRRALGAAADNTRIFSWIIPPAHEGALREAVRAGIELSASTVADILAIAAIGIPARIHLKVDTGMSRAGALIEDFPALVAAAVQARDRGVETVGIWSHLACADEVGGLAQRATDRQIEIFQRALEIAAEGGLGHVTRHLAATSGQLWHPSARYDLVRDGIGLYGLTPNPQHATTVELGLRPVMTVGAPLMLVKHLRAGTAVSYGGTWTAPHDTWIGLIPLGYGDGVPRLASNRARVSVYTEAGVIDAPIIGRVCMDQFVVKLGQGTSAPARIGDTAILFGDPSRADTRGCPTADEWAEACQTINYEIVTRIGPRVPRVYEG
ncbi:MAG: alanine racemase [Actinomycetaceae bacterium]|nr:alanine racemase [Actinomycetaceae bacterium]